MNTPQQTANGTLEATCETRRALAAGIARHAAPNRGTPTPIPELWLAFADAPTEKTCVLYEPSLCVIAQGTKRILLGKEQYTYDVEHCLITAVNLPVTAQIIQASKETPYLGLMLRLDQRAIMQMMVDGGLPAPRPQQARRGMAVAGVSQPLLDAFRRLVDLLDEPESIPVLAPLIQREILFRLLTGEQGQRLRQMAAGGTQSHQVAQAIEWLRGHYNQPLHVEDLAAHVQMSTSTFHRHFRAVTAMSPLQFQKWLRLSEARRIMLSDNLDAASAAFQVGYESHSQFNREYSRLFGAPPLRDIKSLRRLGA